MSPTPPSDRKSVTLGGVQKVTQKWFLIVFVDKIFACHSAGKAESRGRYCRFTFIFFLLLQAGSRKDAKKE